MLPGTDEADSSVSQATPAEPAVWESCWASDFQGL